jgi:glycosyltransferase involved in cell wall biosynthesis
VAALAFCYGAFIIVRTMLFGVVVPGYASELSLMLFFGGLQMIGLGMIGEYVGRIYDEAKGRPIYLVKRRYQERRPRSRVPGNGSRQVIPIASARTRQAQGERQRSHAARR